MECNKNYKTQKTVYNHESNRKNYQQFQSHQNNQYENTQYFRNSCNQRFQNQIKSPDRFPNAPSKYQSHTSQSNFPAIQAIPIFYAIQPLITYAAKQQILPPELIHPVRVNQVQFSKAFENISNKSRNIVEVSSPGYILDLFVKKQLEKSGPIVRYARLSYSLLFAEFATATIAEHAVSRMRRISQLDPKFQNYRYNLTTEEDIAPLILQRNTYSQHVYDTPLCLVVYNFILPPSFKLENIMRAFDLTCEAEYIVDENLLITYHRTEASVKDFYAAFQEGRCSIPDTYVVQIPHLKLLRETVHSIVITKLIETCIDDLKKLLMPDVIIDPLQQMRNKITILKESSKQSFSYITPLHDISINFTLSKSPIQFYLSTAKIQSFQQKVRHAANKRRKDLITNHALEYEKQVIRNIEQGSIISFSSIEQPMIESGSSRLTPIHKITEDVKRKYLRPCALARQRPYLVARQSGLLLKQSQFPVSTGQINQKSHSRQNSQDNPIKENSYIHRFYGKHLYFDKSTIQGFGLFALEPISADTLVCEYVGEIIRSRVADKREKNYEQKGNHMYFFTIDDEFIVDATEKGNTSRFLNHSCDPNCRSKIISIGNMKTISFYTIKNIKPHEEITFNYKMENEHDKNKLVKCYCGSKKCSGYLNYNDNAEHLSSQNITFNDSDDELSDF